jgi:hypothetical protein
MAMDFPNSPTVGQVFQGYTWDGEKWVMTFATPNAGGVIAIKVFTASAPYVPSPNATTCLMECLGGGGAGGGAAGATSQNTGGGGGGGGEYSRKTVTAAQIGASVAVVVGAGGVPNAAGFNPGNDGGNTSVGALCSAFGGAGGRAGNNLTVGQGGLGGSGGVGDFVVAGGNGQAGANTASYISNFVMGTGGGSFFAPGVYTSSTVLNGIAATGVGGGGSGAEIPNSTSTGSGGAGKSGIVIITEFGFTANVTPPGSVVLRSYLAGLTLSTAGSSATFGVAAGVAADSTNAVMMALASAYTKTTAAWAVGSGNGSLDTGAIAGSAWYHVFLIRRPDTGAVDILTSLSATAPTLPASYTQFRRIGSMATASSQWTAFTQNGDEFLWKTPVTNYSSGASSATAILFGLSVPPGVNVLARLSAQQVYVSASTGTVIYAPDTGTQVENSPVGYAHLFTTSAETVSQLTMDVRTDTSARVGIVSNGAGANIWVILYGWFDRRGRDS